MSLKTFLVKVVNEQEITMKIRAENIDEAREMVEDDEWQEHISDQDESDEDDDYRNGRLVTIEASKGFKAHSKPWKVKSIRKSSLKEEL